jgi:hypothetical protein
MSNDVRRMMRTPLSDSDLKKILGADLKIVIYSDLSSVSDLREIMTKDRDCMVVFYEQKKLSGHWTCLTKEGDLFTFFDPYGIAPDTELNWLNMKQRYKLHEDVPHLSNLLSSEQYTYNKVDFQQNDSRIETCGDHVCSFLYCFLNGNINLEQYQEYMKNMKKNTAQPYDYIVASFITRML